MIFLKVWGIVMDRRVSQAREGVTGNRDNAGNQHHLITPAPIQVLDSSKKGRILLAIQAIEQGHIQSIRAAALMYDIPFETLRRRIKGIPSGCESTPNNRRLHLQEESIIIPFILDLNLRGFTPRPSEVRDMANLLLAKRQELPVGQEWVSN